MSYTAYADFIKVTSNKTYNFSNGIGALSILTRKLKANRETVLTIQIKGSGPSRIQLYIRTAELTAPITICIQASEESTPRASTVVEPNADGSAFHCFVCTAEGIEPRLNFNETLGQDVLSNINFRSWLRTEIRLSIITMLGREIVTSEAITNFIHRLVPDTWNWPIYTAWKTTHVLGLDAQINEGDEQKRQLDGGHSTGSLEKRLTDIYAHIPY
jgi:hypothetical protein